MLAQDAGSHKTGASEREPMRTTSGTFASLATSSTALLTTFRRSGAAVPTPVSIRLERGRAYFVTAADSGKAKRLGRDPNVTLAPCTASGQVLGATVRGRARPLEGEERRRARRLLRPTGSLFWSFLLYRLRGRTMRLYEVTPIQSDPAGGAEPAPSSMPEAQRRA